MKQRTGLNRREFLQRCGLAVAAASVVASPLCGGQAIAENTDPSAIQQKENRSLQEHRMTRFGIQIEPQFGFTFPELMDLAKEAERLNYTALWASDHLFFDAHSEQRNCLDAWTLITALAPMTTRLRLGTLVTCNS